MIENQTYLQLREVGEVNHATAFGRIAFAVPTVDIPQIETRVKEAKNGSVITPHVKLDTPGKATVEVVILGDPVSQSVLPLS